MDIKPTPIQCYVSPGYETYDGFEAWRSPPGPPLVVIGRDRSLPVPSLDWHYHPSFWQRWWDAFRDALMPVAVGDWMLRKHQADSRDDDPSFVHQDPWKSP